jgi:hypothetical protein
MQKALVFLLFIPLLALFLWGVNCQSSQVNIDMNTIDQDAYRTYTKQIVESNYQLIGDRNRMPIYPHIMSIFYHPPMSDDALFAVAKQVNTVISLVVLAVTLAILRHYLPWPDAIMAVLVAAFTVFVYKAPFFQAEVLFYGLNFVLFVLLCELVTRPRWFVAVLAGMVAGLAHLTKASVLPAIWLGLGCLILLGIFQLFVAQRQHWAVPARSAVYATWLAAILFVVVFLIVVSPYIRTSNARFGQYFYNVNSTFYIWYDSWEEVKLGTRAHGDRIGWPDMPPEQIPSLHKYLNDHTAAQILERVSQGLKSVWSMTVTSYGYAPFVLVYGAASMLLLWQEWRFLSAQFSRQALVVLSIFVIGYFVGYLLLNAWYTRIAFGNRFVLALFLPLLFCFAWTIGYARRQRITLTVWGHSFLAASAINGVIMLMLGVYLLTVYPSQVCTMYGGF